MELITDGLTKHFGAVRALEDLTLGIEAGEIFGLLGPSGCGKTTALRLIAGLEEATRGRVSFQGEDLTTLPAERRNFGVVFQSYALFPHLSAAENIAFGLRARGSGRKEIEDRVSRVLDMVRLAGKGNRPIHELSGGEQQRVALARAIVIEPRALLLDEPLSSLDVTLREETRQQLREIIRVLGITTIFVTHDQEEAFDLCDRIAVISGGRLQQVGRPGQLYAAPANLFVAGFVGKANVIPARIVETGTPLVCELPNGCRVSVRILQGKEVSCDQQVNLSVRPEHLSISGYRPEEDSGSAGPDTLLRGVLEDVRHMGAVTRFYVNIAGLRVVVTQAHNGVEAQLQAGQMCFVHWPADRSLAFERP